MNYFDIAFYSVDPSSNTVEVYSFYSITLIDKYENRLEEAGYGHLGKNIPQVGHVF